MDFTYKNSLLTFHYLDCITSASKRPHSLEDHSPLYFRLRMSKANTYINMQPVATSVAQQLYLKKPQSPSSPSPFFFGWRMSKADTCTSA